MADGIMDFFSKEAGQARTKARDEFIDGILGAARRAAEYYLGPTGIPDRASSAGRVAAEMNPVVGIMDAMQASGEGRYGDAALETAMALAPAYAATKAARPVSEAVQEVLLGGSAAAGDAGRAFVERMNQRGPMPTVYSNPVDFNAFKKARAQEEFVGKVNAAVDDVLSGAYQARMDQSAFDLHKSGNLPLPVGTRVSTPSSYEMGSDLRISGYWVDPQDANVFGYKLQNDAGEEFREFVNNPRLGIKSSSADSFGGGFKAFAGPNADDRLGFSTPSSSFAQETAREPISDSVKKEYDALFGSILPPARNEAEAMAKRILDMRAAGNAADVTDEMMAQADPQYMFYNTPLPMDEASRMERAREMGFDDKKPRYHGSDLDLSYLDPDMGSGERYRTGVFSTDNPDVADSYVTTRGGEIYPIITRRNDSGATINASGENWNKIPQSAPASLSGSVLEQEFPELYSDVSITAYDVAPYLYADLFGRGASTNALARQRRFEGDSNITFQNLVDRGPAIKRYLDETKEMQKARELSASQPSEVRVDFYGNQIRSPFARFDPAFKNLKNLSAATGIPVTGLLGYSMLQDEQQ